MNGADQFRALIRLEQPRLGSQVVWATDDFFGAKERLIESADPVFIPDKYDENGKWMDGWESRRRREPGHDSCVIKLGVPGVVKGFEIDTRHFTGNYPEFASIDLAESSQDVPTKWTPVVSKTALRGNDRQYIDIGEPGQWTHARLNIYPDGGVARLRIFGEVQPNGICSNEPVDLLSVLNGGRALSCSDEHFGSMHNLNLPDKSLNMGDGWETARRRGPGNDWVVFALGCRGEVSRAIVDTAFFKGNYPASCSIDIGDFESDAAACASSASWHTLLKQSPLGMDCEHRFDKELSQGLQATHARLSIFPDGGVARLRLFGLPAR